MVQKLIPSADPQAYDTELSTRSPSHSSYMGRTLLLITELKRKGWYV
jgi:hypothetical protein